MDEEFKRLRQEGYRWDGTYYCSEQLSNGQTITIAFIHVKLSRNEEYHVVLAITNKKKHVREWVMGTRDLFTNESTGTCGLEGLFWAKRKLAAFEVFMVNQIESQRKAAWSTCTIVVGASDSRRKRVYERGLKKLGYVKGVRSQYECLSKRIS